MTRPSRQTLAPTARSAPPVGRRAAGDDPSAELPVQAPAPVAETAKTFRHVFCAFHGIAVERFAHEMFDRAVFRRVRWLRPLISLFNKHFFAVDLQFVRSIGKVTTIEELNAELDEFLYHPRNRRWARHSLKLRLSTRRILDIAEPLMPELLEGAAGRPSAARSTRTPFSDIQDN